MVAETALTTGATRGTARLLAALVAEEASATHPHLRSLEVLDGADAARNATDALHHFSMLHGRHPGVLDHAAARTTNEARRAMFDLADGFAAERELLARLVVAAGPVPSTPGQSETEASVVHQRHAIEMLAQSDRHGCAAGAALAVAQDWLSIRRLLDASARRFGVDARPTALPDAASVANLARTIGDTPAAERAMLFGAQQIASQHCGLWDLLEARAQARRDQ